MLEIRLNILNDVVDRFVIVEATHNWHGMFKGLLFSQPENLKRFEKFLHKIEYVVVTDMPPFQGIEGSDDEGPALELETFNRDAIARGLSDAKDEDVIMISDFDEIPRPEIMSELIPKDNEIFVLKMPSFIYRLNSLSKISGSYCTTTTMFKKKLLNSYTASQIRWNSRDILEHGRSDLLPGAFASQIDHAGWHFSWIGDEAFINQKLDGYRHEDFRSQEGRSILVQRMKNAQQNEDSQDTINVKIDSYFPEYVINNLKKHAHIVSNNFVDLPTKDLVDKYRRSKA